MKPYQHHSINIILKGSILVLVLKGLWCHCMNYRLMVMFTCSHFKHPAWFSLFDHAPNLFGKVSVMCKFVTHHDLMQLYDGKLSMHQVFVLEKFPPVAAYDSVNFCEIKGSQKYVICIYLYGFKTSFSQLQ